ncbi:MAG: calcium-translocating P-type ATPase, PMCA-type [Candidatus Electrothrix sp. YB6]
MYHFKGLTRQEIEASRIKHGSNQLSAVETETFWDKLLDNFKDPMIIILTIALVIVTILAAFGQTEWYEGVGIAFAVVLATLVATASEFKNEQTFQKLQEEASKIQINVFREDSVTVVGIDDVVVGDVILLQPGDKIPADGRILEGKVAVSQAALTGEPEPRGKTPGEADVSDLEDAHAVFRGTVIEDGEAVMEVLQVGDNTHLGRLAEELETDERMGPLRVKLARLAHGIAVFGYITAPLIALAFLFKAVYLDNSGDMSAIAAYAADWTHLLSDIVKALILAVIIIVVAVPEGLPMMIAIVLAQNMRKLLRSNVLVRQLLGVETSGSLNLLFTDKTGTVTKGLLETVGFLTVADTDMKDAVRQYDSFEKLPEQNARLLDLSLRENTSSVVNCKATTESERIVGGNSTDRALLKFVHAESTECQYEEKTTEKVDELLFNSTRKFSAVRIRKEDGQEMTLIKGAPEKIFAQCGSFYDSQGNVAPLPAERKTAIVQTIDSRTDEGFRLIAVAVTEEPIPANLDAMTGQLTLLGFAMIRDDLRPEAADTVKELHSAGIQVVMITGDRKGTAQAIAKEAGLITSPDDVVLTSDEMADLSDDALKKIIPNLKVVSRCLPSDKSRLVKVTQEMGLVVGMTGDGVNDSPALSSADIGFGLGSGTEVAKEASDIVVLDDNIQSIANAVHYGRTIYHSIQKFITFQLTVNVAAISIAFLGPFLGFELPLTMIQLLWVNLIMDTLAALAFSGEPPLPEYMEEKPKEREEHIITSRMWQSILGNGFFMTAVCVLFLKASFVHNLFASEEVFMTAFFGIFVFLNNFNKFNVRVEDWKLFDHLSANKGFLQVVGMIFLIQIVITYIGGEVFRTVALGVQDWFWVIVFSIVIVPFDLARKSLFNKNK